MSSEQPRPGTAPDDALPGDSSTDPTAAGSSSEAAPVPFFKRRLPKIVLFLGMAGIIIHLFQSQPVLVDLTYEYGRGRRGLREARVRYMQNGVQTRWVLFDYRQTPAGSRQRHQARMLKGDYSLEVELTYRGQPPAAVHGQRVEGSGGEVKVWLERPLLVRGEGEVIITLAE